MTVVIVELLITINNTVFVNDNNYC